MNERLHLATLHAGLIVENARLKKSRLHLSPKDLSHTVTIQNARFVRSLKKKTSKQYLKNAKVCEKVFQKWLNSVTQLDSLDFNSWEENVRLRHRILAGIEGKGQPYTFNGYTTNAIGAGLFRDEIWSDKTVFFDFNTAPEDTKVMLRKYKVLKLFRKIEVVGLKDFLQKKKILKKILIKVPVNHLGIHFFPSPDKTLISFYKRLVFKRFTEALTHLQKPKSSKNKIKVLSVIADYYHTAINAHLFFNINNSLHMMEVNCFLEKSGWPYVVHSHLDALALAQGYKYFRKVFINYLCSYPSSSRDS